MSKGRPLQTVERLDIQYPSPNWRLGSKVSAKVQESQKPSLDDPNFLIRRAMEERAIAARATDRRSYQDHLLLAHEFENRLIAVTAAASRS